MELSFNKKQEKEFLASIVNAFKAKKPDEFLKLFMTKEDSSELLEKFEPKSDADSVYKKYTKLAEIECSNLFAAINKHIPDIEECVVTTESTVSGSPRSRRRHFYLSHAALRDSGL